MNKLHLSILIWFTQNTSGKGHVFAIKLKSVFKTMARKKWNMAASIFPSPYGIWQNRHWLDSLHHALPSTPGHTYQAYESEAGWWWSAPLDSLHSYQPAGWLCLLCLQLGSAHGPRRSALGGAMVKPPAAHRQWCPAVDLSGREIKRLLKYSWSCNNEITVY